MNRDAKKKVMKSFGKHAKDTGSAYVQVAVLTERIKELTSHLKTHKKDNHSRLGLLKLVGKRRSHLQYIKTKDREGYETLVADLGIRK